MKSKIRVYVRISDSYLDKIIAELKSTIVYREQEYKEDFWDKVKEVLNDREKAIEEIRKYLKRRGYNVERDGVFVPDRFVFTQVMTEPNYTGRFVTLDFSELDPYDKKYIWRKRAGIRRTRGGDTDASTILLDADNLDLDMEYDDYCDILFNI